MNLLCYGVNMATEFNKILNEAKKGSVEEKIDALARIIEDMMHIVLTMPDIFDQITEGINKKINDLETMVNQINKTQPITEIKQVSPEASQLPSVKELKKPQITRPPNTKRLILDELKELFKKRESVNKSRESDTRIECTICGKKVAPHEKICPFCGNALNK